MAVRVVTLVAALLVAHCAVAHAYLYNYCQAPLPRYVPPPNANLQLVCERDASGGSQELADV